MKVREIFYSIQGEGGRAGEASIFIRLANCNLNCWFCDTDWSYGEEMTIEEIREEISKYKCEWIVWTGGEPTLQLTEEILEQFPEYKHAIETNGTNKPPHGLDYIVCSPKKEVHIQTLRDNFAFVSEFRYVFDGTQEIPSIKDLPYADNYYVSPIFLGEKKKRFDLDEDSVEKAVEFVKNNPEWKFSLQVHKIINVR